MQLNTAILLNYAGATSSLVQETRTRRKGDQGNTDMIVNKVLISPVLIASVILNVISGFLITNPAEFQQIGKIASSCPEQYYCPSD